MFNFSKKEGQQTSTLLEIISTGLQTDFQQLGWDKQFITEVPEKAYIEFIDSNSKEDRAFFIHYRFVSTDLNELIVGFRLFAHEYWENVQPDQLVVIRKHVYIYKDSKIKPTNKYYCGMRLALIPKDAKIVESI